MEGKNYMAKVQNMEELFHTDLVEQAFPDVTKTDHCWEETM